MERRTRIELADTLGFLLGRWSVLRRVQDHVAERQLVFEGEARVEPGGPGASARYEESGHTMMGSYRGRAGRHLDVLGRPDGSALFRFTDGRPFIVCDLRCGRWQATHPCGADLYEISFRVDAPDRLEERWRVVGPDTDYEALTWLVRKTGPGPAGGRAGVGA